MLPIARNIIHILMEKSLLTQADVVDGSSIFAVARQRNRFCYYKRRQGPSYFIKTGHEEEPGAAKAMGLEAAILQHMFADPNFAALRPHLVRLYDFDPATGTLISELVENAHDLTVAARTAPGDVAQHLEQVMGCLAALHQVDASGILNADLGFDTRPHWIFRLADTSGPIEQLRARSASGAATINRIAAHTGWMRMLRQLGLTWSKDCLIHGDVKPQNVLFQNGNAATDRYKLIDWERATMGDPCWDVACAVATPLLLAVFAEGGVNTRYTPSDLLTAEVQSQMRGTLTAYHAAVSGPLRRKVFHKRCGQMVIARLLAAAYELNFVVDQMTPLADSLLDLADALSKDPFQNPFYYRFHPEAA